MDMDMERQRRRDSLLVSSLRVYRDDFSPSPSPSPSHGTTLSAGVRLVAQPHALPSGAIEPGLQRIRRRPAINLKLPPTAVLEARIDPRCHFWFCREQSVVELLEHGVAVLVDVVGRLGLHRLCGVVLKSVGGDGVRVCVSACVKDRQDKAEREKERQKASQPA
jgi:hypothetical protein